MVPRGRPPESAHTSISQSGELIELGRIVNKHGIGGEVRVLPHNPGDGVLAQLAEVLLTRDGGSTERRSVRGWRRHKHFVLLRLDDVASANDAEALIGCGVAIPRAELPAPGESVYHVDLIGCTVRTTNGESLGTVEELIVTGSNDVCVVRGAGREVLIPLVADVIETLDIAARSIIVRPLPGLLDD